MYKLLIILSAFLVSGCAGSALDHADSDMTSIDPDKAIVIFSIDAEQSIEEQSVGLVWWDSNGEYQRGNIRQSPSDESLQRFILEVPGKLLIFDTVAIKYERQWWIAGGSRRVELETGKLTYLGNIEIQDIQYDNNLSRLATGSPDGSKGSPRPLSIRLAFIDESESDLGALKLKYSVFEEHPISINIPQNWGPHTYMPLSFVPKSKRKSLDPTVIEILGAFDLGYDPF